MDAIALCAIGGQKGGGDKRPSMGGRRDEDNGGE